MKALIVVDLQNDFMPGGALGVPKADELAPLVNRLMDRFDIVFATADWHPPNHVSFAATHQAAHNIEQILWPVHCVRHTWGAELVAQLRRDRIAEVFYKGVDPLVDSYSAFFDSGLRQSTGLADALKRRSICDLYICGVATDYCVYYSVLDALRLGFQVAVIADACRAIGDGEKALREMERQGARIVVSSELLS